MRWRRRLVKIFGSLLATLLLLAGAAAAVFFWPGLLINATTLALGARVAGHFGVQLHWQDLQVQATSEAIWRKRFALTLTEACVDVASVHLHSCLPTATAAVSVWVKPGQMHVSSIGPVHITASAFRLGPLPPSPPQPGAADWHELPRPAWLAGTVLAPVTVDIAGADIRVGPEVVPRSESVRVTGRLNFTLLPLSADAQGVAGAAQVHLALNDICLPTSPLLLTGCVRALDAQAQWAVAGQQFVLAELGPVALEARSLSLLLPPSPRAPVPGSLVRQIASPAAPPPSPLAPLRPGVVVLPPLLANTQFKPLHLLVDRFSVQHPQGEASGGIRFDLAPGRDPAAAALSRQAAEPGGLWEARLVLLHPCANGLAIGIRGCFAMLDVSTRFLRELDSLRALRLGPLAATHGWVMAQPPESAAKPMNGAGQTGSAAAAPSDWSNFLTGGGVNLPLGSPVVWLNGMDLAPVSIDIDRLQWQQGATSVLGAAHLRGGPDGPRGSAWTLAADIPSLSALPIRHAQANVALASRASRFTGPWQLSIRGDAALVRGGDVTLQADAHPETARGADQTALSLDAGYQAGSAKVAAQLRGALTAHALDITIAGETSGFVPKIKQIALDNCRLALDWQHAQPVRARAELGCFINVQPEPLVETTKILKDWPTQLRWHLSSQADLPWPLRGTLPVVADAILDLDPVTMQTMQATSHSEAHLNGNMAQPPASLSLQIASATQLAVPDFQALVKYLEPTVWAVPAPFNVLAGQIVARCNADGDLLRQGLHLPFALSTRLATPAAMQPEEHLDTDLVGAVQLGPFGVPVKPDLHLDYRLANVQLVLPRLDVTTKLPQLLPDKRIQRIDLQAYKDKALDVGKPANAIDYDVAIATPKDKPLRLVSNLAKAPIPIAIGLSTGTTHPTRGGIDILQFPLNLFRRQAFVDKFTLSFTRPTTSPAIDGDIRVVYPDYTVHVLITGTTDSPTVNLVSQPPLPQRQLIGVLLFGRDMNELDEDQLRSADSLGAALADSALSLGSLYLLASTPVQSVGYDPANKAFTARITLAQGTSLNIGSDLADYQKLGLQRRLNRDWALETYIERNSDTDDQAVTALLEWRRRF